MIRSFGKRSRTLGRLEREAGAWIRRLTSGRVTEAEVQAFQLWRASSAEHAAAFSRAHQIWRHLGVAGARVSNRKPLPSAPPRSGFSLPRRAFLGGALAGGGALAAVALAHPPLGLWPALWDPQADYRTAVGEQREVSLDNVLVALNTQTRIVLRPDTGDARAIELLGGEAAVEMAHTVRSFMVLAGAGQTLATTPEARFEVRRESGRTCVTCLSGVVRVGLGRHGVELLGNQQVAYDQDTLGMPAAVDAAVTSAWRQGMLVFHQTPLSKVIAEFNRYRPGRVLLADDDKGRLPLNGRFRIDNLDEGLRQIAQAFQMKQRSLAGFTLLG